VFIVASIATQAIPAGTRTMRTKTVDRTRTTATRAAPNNAPTSWMIPLEDCRARTLDKVAAPAVAPRPREVRSNP
jgi:hypothetical protein